jgi:lysophospholipase L1-like esterase
MRSGQRVGRALAFATAVLCLAASTSASSADGPTATSAVCGKQTRFKPGTDLPGRAPLAIGDSVLLGAAEEVAEIGFSVDVRQCRFTDESLDVLRKVADAGKLPKVVVISVGANDVVARDDLAAALKLLGPRRVLGLVTPIEIGGRGGSDAKTMRALAACKPKRTVLLDWVRYARKHPDATYDDRIHLTPEGQEAMARMFRRALPERLAKRAIPKARC